MYFKSFFAFQNTIVRTVIQKIVSSVLIVFVFGSFTFAHAATTGQFNVNVTVGADTIAPSVPTGLTATAISSSQINLSWTASTDNIAVTGYKIYRDSTYLTTVVGTTYSDIGLTASTLYSYTVSAIDGSSNESAQSASASATTQAASTTPPPSSPTGSPTTPSNRVPVIYDIKIVPGKTSAIISWKTVDPTTGTLSWGLTNNYEMGASSESAATTNHQITISGLRAGTQYVFQIDAVSTYGVHGYAGNQKFNTLTLEAGSVNASNFTATAETKDILLNWKNPETPDFSEVRIVRNDTFYPADPQDGEIVYEGNASSFIDTGVEIGTRYYYTLFVKYQDGNYSSGLISSARIPNPGEIEQPVDVIGNLPQAPSVHPMIAALTFQDFDFIQDGKKIDSFAQGKTVSIDGNKNLTVSIAYEKVPEVLKTIAVTLTDPDDNTKVFSFLLRVNKDKTAYLATLAPLGKSGKYGVRIAVIDYKNRGLKNIVGSLVASAQDLGNRKLFWALMLLARDNFLDLLLLLILLAIIARVLRGMVQKHKKEEKEIVLAPFTCAIDEDDEVKNDSKI